jgi:hypothetical protein
MTLRDDSRTRVPGPVGSTPMGARGRIPGPLGFQVVLMAPGPVVNVKKALKMPPPAGNETYYVHSFVSKLVGKSGPAVDDVQQGALANCPIAAILAALAHTESGRKRIIGMVSEHAALVETDLSGIASKLDSPPKNNKIITNRYFTVSLGKAIEVSDVLYTDDADANWSPIYMKSPTDVLWACMIEKAFAVQMGSYEELDREGVTVNQFWRVLLGADPKVISINDKTDLSTIKAAATAASKIPTIGASRDDPTIDQRSAGKVTNWHGYAVLGIRGSNIALYDPHRKKVELSLAEFRSYFQAIFFGNL